MCSPDPTPGPITGCALTRASGPDADAAVMGLGLLAANDSTPPAACWLLHSTAWQPYSPPGRRRRHRGDQDRRLAR